MPNLSAAHLVRLRVRRTARRRVSPPRAPRAPGVAYAAALHELFDGWHKIVRAELATADLHIDATVRLPDVRSKVLGLRTQIANFFTSEKTGNIAMRAGIATARFAQRETARVIGIPLGDTLPAATLHAFRQENVAKIKGLAVSELDRIEGLLDRASTTGLRVEEIGDDIQEQFGVTESYATFIARDQTLRLNGQVTQERQVQAGVVRYTWITSRDERVRPSHRDLDGSEQMWGLAPVVDEKTGRRAHPGQDYQCRCTASPVLDDVF